jgi:hypothetical protein
MKGQVLLGKVLWLVLWLLPAFVLDEVVCGEVLYQNEQWLDGRKPSQRNKGILHHRVLFPREERV